MCIVLLSTQHPDFPLILLSNRDEKFSRPTLPVCWWEPPLEHVLGGRDLLRDTHGTWLGVTKQGRLAALTNFRDEGDTAEGDLRSRGQISKAYLATPPDSSESPAEFAQRLVEEEGVQGVGGFSLIFGQLRPSSLKFGVVSNRTTDKNSVLWVPDDSGKASFTCSLSNSHYGDRAWPKVLTGEQLLERLVTESKRRQYNENQLIGRCFEILSVNTMPQRQPGQDLRSYAEGFKRSIFIPPVRMGDDDARGDITAGAVYGTKIQTVLVVNKAGTVSFCERTLYDDEGEPVELKEQYRDFRFEIQGWND